MSQEETLLPEYEKLDVALRSIGYSFETAVADIIDNSIDAQADHVLVRLVTYPDRPLDLVIYDDGDGMDEATLREAMRFGANVSQEIQRLGKFGLGLKLASLSQAKAVRVYSRAEGKLSGRGWLEDGIRKGFISHTFDEDECSETLQQLVPDKPLRHGGTVVWWSDLYRTGQNHSDATTHLEKLLRRLKNHLSLSFHRFLSGRPRRVQISYDVLDLKSGHTGLATNLDPLNPFGYLQTGQVGFPAEMHLGDGFRDRVKLTAHVWPPNSQAPEYKLPGGVNSRQGFYFYRNDRLIQGGGWNTIREVEPHSSLARLEVDVSPDLDLDISLDVKKVEIQLPRDLVESLQVAKTDEGIDFKKYLALADKAYRTRKRVGAEVPVVPTDGIPAPLRDFLAEELRLAGTSKRRNVSFEWRALDPDTLIDVDRDRDVIYLNRDYRRQLLHGLSGSATDVPVFKCLVFLLFRDLFYAERLGSKQRERLEQSNRILTRAVKYERYER